MPLPHSPHAIKTWTHELRHGGHVQCPDFLEITKADGSVCRCVQGVALYLAEQCGVTLNRTALPAARTINGEPVTVSRFGTLTGALPEEVIRWLGLPFTSGDAGGHFAVGQLDQFLTGLAKRNDAGETFEELADHIDAFFASN